MKKLALLATISTMLALLFVLAFPTSVMGSPARIEDPSFENPTDNWTYSYNGSNYIDGPLSTEWKTQGLYSYKISSTLEIDFNTHGQIYQSVNFTNLDTLSFDARLWNESEYFEAQVLVGTDVVWSQVPPTTAANYTHQEVDVSGYIGTQNLIFRITCTKSPSSKKAQTNYFDNIKIWGSYSDSNWQTVWNNFSGSTNHVYMYGENFDSGTTKVGYYDGADNLKQTDTTTGWGGGTLDWSECLFTDYATDTAAEGTWHAVVLLQADALPNTYAGAIVDPDYVTDDDFYVDASAIPEFPAVIAGIGVAGLCFGIYYWMRKRKLDTQG